CWYTKKTGRICYFNSSGKRVHGKWKKIDGNYYYFNDSGYLATSQWVGDYYVDENGLRMTNCVVDGYTLDASGKKTAFTGKYIFVGDCRTVGMSYAISKSNTYFIGEVSMGLIRLKTVASVELASYLSVYPNAKVILGYGLNDLYQLDNYISYYKTLISKYPKAQFYILSINPINETLASKNGYTVKTSQIKAFNQAMQEAFPDNYLDTYTWLEQNGFSASDGIHYVSSTYVKLYDYIISVIGYN
ncbi:MAG: hypothetical protein LUF30_09045, partial [Lachnospiraceae bacterium]|nr:hypothetical protein [Lachnospiraceae bacterium]